MARDRAPRRRSHHVTSPLVVLDGMRRAGARPGPLLEPLGASTVLGLAVGRLQPFSARHGAHLVLTLADDPTDDAAAAHAEELGLRVVRARAGDALGALTVAKVRLADDVDAPLVRLDAAGPLIDPFVVSAAVDLHIQAEADYTSNLLPRSYPRGLDVEVLSDRAVRACELDVADDPSARFDPTLPVRRQPHRFRFALLASGHAVADEPWSATDPDAIDHLRALVGQIPDPLTTSWNRILAITGRRTRPLPRTVELHPEGAPEPGSVPWVRRWRVRVDGDDVGTVEAVIDAAGSHRTVDVPADLADVARDALFRQLTDPRTPTP